MVAESVAVGNCYGRWYVSLSTGSLRRKIERSSGMLAFIFIKDVVIVKRKMFIGFRWKGGVAIADGDHHGGVVSDRNSYGDLCSLVYHCRGTAGRCLLSKLWMQPRELA